MGRIQHCIWRQKNSTHGRQCNNPLRADGTKYISCPYDGRRSPGACMFWDDGKTTAEDLEVVKGD